MEEDKDKDKDKGSVPRKGGRIFALDRPGGGPDSEMDSGRILKQKTYFTDTADAAASQTSQVISTDLSADGLTESVFSSGNETGAEKTSGRVTTEAPSRSDIEQMLDPILEFYQVYAILETKKSTSFDINTLTTSQSADDFSSPTILTFPIPKYFRLGSLTLTYLPGDNLSDVLGRMSENLSLERTPLVIKNIVSVPQHTLTNEVDTANKKLATDVQSYVDLCLQISYRTRQFAETAGGLSGKIAGLAQEIKGYGYLSHKLDELRAASKELFDLGDSREVLRAEFEVGPGYINDLVNFLSTQIHTFKKSILNKVAEADYARQVNSGQSLATSAASWPNELDLSVKLFFVDYLCRKFEEVKELAGRNSTKPKYVGLLDPEKQGSIVMISMKYPYKSFDK